MNHLVISFVGQDKPGIVDKLSNLVKAHHGNWQNSSLHHLSGTFAGVIEVSATSENINALNAELMAFEELKIVTETSSQRNEESQSAIVTLELTANDRSGIVQDISSVIHKQGGNLVKLVSKQGAAPHTGQMMFNAKAQISVADNQLSSLVDALERIEDDLMVDITK